MVDLASQGNPNFVGDLTTLATFDDTASMADAERLVKELERQGGHPVLGLLGLPPSWAERYGRGRHELYDACVNLWVGTAILAGHYEACVAEHAALFTPASSKDRRQRVAPPEAVRLCALRRFGADLGVEGYAEAIVRLLPRQRLLFTPVSATTAGWLPSENACHCRDRDQCGSSGSAAWITYPKQRRAQPPTNLPRAPILD
jgi:hypothetical protein